ncbi:hypothetical protein SUGI_0868810 [Cryptomeria japonica]|nr:hypothetical protein SUGI_0868810 [Cryptomeria japonica]
MYRIPPMQGEARMCRKVEDFYKTVHPNKKGIRIAGLYGMSGMGKTDLGKAFCNHNLRNYDGKVFHIEFCGGNAFDTQELTLQHLTHSRNSQFERVTGENDVHYFFCNKVEGQSVLLVLDNITDDSIDKVRGYLHAVGEGSCILLIARSVDVLVKNFNIDSQSCMRIPRLRVEEAIAIMLKITSTEYGDIGLALKCAKRCLFKEDRGTAPRFHPLALKALGRHCFSKHRGDLSKWVDEIDDLPCHDFDGLSMAFDIVFDVLGLAFDSMDPKSRSIFMLLTLLIPHKLSSYSLVINVLAENCKEEVS